MRALKLVEIKSPLTTCPISIHILEIIRCTKNANTNISSALFILRHTCDPSIIRCGIAHFYRILEMC